MKTGGGVHFREKQILIKALDLEFDPVTHIHMYLVRVQFTLCP